jgi:uncharacterized protein (DUF2267 family)
MDYPSIVKQFSDETSLPKEKAEAFAHAFVRILGRRLTDDEAKDLASQLPRELARELKPTGDVQRLSYAEFKERLTDEAEVDNQQVEDFAKNYWALLRNSISAGEVSHLETQLPEDFKPLFSKLP